MKYFFTLLLLISIPATVFARPATEPTIENAQKINDAYNLIKGKYEISYLPCSDVDWDNEYFNYYAFFIQKGVVVNNDVCGPYDTLQSDTLNKWLRSILPLLEARNYSKERRKIDMAIESLNSMSGGMVDANTLTELQLPVPYGANGPMNRGKVLKELYNWLPYTIKYPQIDFSSNELYSLNKHFIYYGETPIRGIAVNWSVKPYYDKRYMEEEILKMKEMGVVAISVEVGWDTIEHKEDNYDFPRYFETLLKLAEENGLFVDILIAGHYTPSWVKNKYGDIRMYDSEGRPVSDGSYMTFAPTSPAIEDLKEFQAEVIKHYEEYPNVMAFFLSNEQSYGNKAQLDYSTWAKKAWTEYRQENGLVPFDADMPVSDEESTFVDWQLFRQDMLVNYLNELYENAAFARGEFRPIGHKIIFYEATSAYSRDYGIYPASTRLKQDIVGSDIYGYTPNVYPAENAFNKPIMVIETNLPYNWEAKPMYEYLVMQYYQNLPLQTIFQWNEGTHPNVMFYNGGKWWNKTFGIQRAIDFINSSPIPEYPDSNTALVLPRKALARNGNNYHSFQYVFDDAIWELEKEISSEPIILWSDEFTDNENTVINSLISSIGKIIVINSAIDSIDGNVINNWKILGGVLVNK